MKIRGDIVRLYRAIHSWVGIMAGLFLFIAFYAGGMTMFEEPLEYWGSRSDTLPAPVSMTQLPELLQKASKANPAAATSYTVVLHPDPVSPSSLMWSVSQDRDHGPARTVYAGLAPDGTLVTRSRTPSQAAYFINILHQRIGLPLGRTSGRLIMGFVALLYAVALVSGTITLLPSLVRNLFVLRLGENLRRVWMDFHTLLGVCSLPFHIVIAATAAGFAFQQPVLALEHALFIPAPHVEMARHKHPGNGNSSHVKHGNMPAPGQIVAILAEQAPDFTPDKLTYSTRNGKISLRVTGHDFRHVTRRADGGYVDINPYDGHMISTDYLPGHQSHGFVALTTIYALHFGTFGGLAGQICYALLGMGGAFLFYSGNQLWLSSRRQRERSAGLTQASSTTRALSILTTGCMLGCMSGISAILAAVPLLPEGGHYQTVEILFYAVFLACLATAVCLGGDRSRQPLLLATGLLTILIPMTDGTRVLSTGLNHVSVIIDLLALLYGAVLILIASHDRKTLYARTI
ncbi:PepSY-associated TM helix domain-containing protein [Gluconobacter morbifer]|uniref:PepSY-associated TM helix domain-containing protein n=1 Tax=Gluconobacter morbifer G707 TaxID=1088869 RepID=G6XHH1_9PROT|nr:PepSY-associated TM helix domain-containing protein [Gluconobacter morbifer]EHH69629.1 hypothetical protein GMO_09370 [Gluconobacter morbifer G707]